MTASEAPHLQRGQNAENVAAAYLEGRGFRIHARNFRCAVGEIDLVAECGSELHFIEVKGRWTQRAGGPLEQVTPRQMKRIGRAAQYYLQKQPDFGQKRLYFSVIGIDGRHEPVQIHWVPDAFELL